MKGWKAILSQVAPTIAGALGGPAAGGAVRILAKALLGKEEASEAEIGAAIAGADPTILLQLKQLELEYAKTMADVGIKFEELDQADRASARARETAVKDWVPATLALATVAAYVVITSVILLRALPSDSREIVIANLRILETLLIFVFGYYFGSSAGSRLKTLLGKDGKPSNGGS